MRAAPLCYMLLLTSLLAVVFTDLGFKWDSVAVPEKQLKLDSTPLEGASCCCIGCIAFDMRCWLMLLSSVAIAAAKQCEAALKTAEELLRRA